MVNTIATGFQSLSILSNLGWELSSSLVDTPLTSTLIENIDIAIPTDNTNYSYVTVKS